MGAMATTKFDRSTAQRLKRLRLALGYEESAPFARALGITPNRWNNYERGFPLPTELALRLRDQCRRDGYSGLSLDWIYDGDADNLPVKLAIKLGEVRATFTKRRV
jgi:transcriptional regulator with XRE-family HTH domain